MALKDFLLEQPQIQETQETQKTQKDKLSDYLLDVSPAEKTTVFGAIETGAPSPLESKYISGYRPTYGTYQEYQAQKQSNWAKAGNMIARGVIKAALNTVEPFGHILDFEEHYNAINGYERDYSNAFNDFTTKLKYETLPEAFPVYTKEEQPDLFTSDWFFKNFDEAIASLGYFVPGAAISKAVGLGIKGLGAATQLTKVLPKTVKGVADIGGPVAAAIGQNYSEHVLSAVQTLKQNTEKYIESGILPEEAKRLASKDAEQVIEDGKWNLLLQIPEYLMLFRGTKWTRSFSKQSLPTSTAKKIAGITGVAGMEYLEEANTGFYEKEAARAADIKTGKIKEGEEGDEPNKSTRYFNHLASYEGLTEGLIGAFGGAGMKTISNILESRNKTAAKNQIKDNEAFAGNLANFKSITKQSLYDLAHQNARAGTYESFLETLKIFENTTQEEADKLGFNKDYKRIAREHIEDAEFFENEYNKLSDKYTKNPVFASELLYQKINERIANQGLTEIQSNISRVQSEISNLRNIEKVGLDLGTLKNKVIEFQGLKKALDETVKEIKEFAKKDERSPKYNETFEELSSRFELLSKKVTQVNKEIDNETKNYLKNNPDKTTKDIQSFLTDLSTKEYELIALQQFKENALSRAKNARDTYNKLINTKPEDIDRIEKEIIEKAKPVKKEIIKTKAIIEGKETEGELWADNKGQSYLKVKKSPTEFSSYPIEQKDGIWTQKITEPIETETIRPELTIESIANKITKAEPLTPEEEEFRRNNSEAIETELQKAALKQPPPTDIKAKIADIEKRRQEELREHYEPTEKEKAEGALGYIDERLVSIRNEIKKQRLVMPSEIKKASDMTRKLLELGWSPQRIVERLNKDFGFNIEYKETETDRINAKYDAEYLTEVKDGRMTREQAMQALEEAGRKESKTYTELAALEKAPEQLPTTTPTTVLKQEQPLFPHINEDFETVNKQTYPEDSAKSIIWNKSINSKDDDSKPSNNRFYRFVEKTKKSELSNYFFQVVTKTNNLKLYNEILDARKNEKDTQGRNARQYEEQQLKETGKEYQGVYLLLVDKKGNSVLKDNQYIFSTFPRIARALEGKVLLTNEEVDAALLFRIHLLEQTEPIYLPIIDKSEGFPQFEATIKGERQYFSLKDRFTVQSLELLTLEISDKPGWGRLKNGLLGQTGKLYAHDSEGHIIDLIPRKLTSPEIDKIVDLIKQQLGLLPKTVENTSKELNKLIYFRIPKETSTHTLGINKDGTLQIGNSAIPFDETKLRDFLTNTKRVNVNNIDFNSEFTDIFGTKHPTYQHYLTEGENPLFQTDLLPTSQVQYRNQYLIFDSSIKPFTTKETKTPVKDKKPLIKKDRKTLDRLKTLETNTRIPISDEEREWFKSSFPTIPIESVQGLIENKAFGRFLNSGRVLLSDQATTGTLYHESFHITTQLYLTPTELNRLYREVKEKTTARTDLEAEELLAEDFFNYKKTGKILNDRPARNTIFKRLLNFIKDLLNLPASSIEDIYRRLDKGYYTNRPVIGIRQFSRLDRSKISEEKGVAFEAEAISNVGALYYDHLFKGSTVNGEFIIRTPDEVDKQISVDIYNQILTNLEEKYEAEENLQIAANIEYIYNNLDELFDLFIEKNKIKGIEITTEEFEEDLDENEETKVNRTYQEANEVSTRSQINDQVWELISSLKQKNSDGSDKLSEHTNLPQLVNSSSLYNFLLRQLAGLSTYEEMIEKIDKLANTRPTLTELLDRLGEPSVTARLEQQVLQDQFRQDFGKTYITSYKTVLKEDGTVYFVDANTELSAGRTLERWKNNIITKTVQTEEGKLTLNLDSIHFTNAESFLDSVGFNFSEEGLKAAKKDDNFQTSVVAIQNYIKERKGDITTLFEPTREEREAKTDVKGRLTYLAALEADNSPDTAELSFVSSTGKTIFAIGNNSTLSITVNKINKANTLAELYTDLPYLNTVSTEGSAWLNELFDATGKRRPNKKLTIALQDGVSNDADSLIDFESPTARLTSGDKWIQEINSILNGRSSLIRTSDKKSEFTVFMDKPLFSIEELKTLDNERLKEVIRGYFKSELKRIALHRTLGIGKDRDKIDEHGDKFTALQDIVSADMKKAINAELDTIKDVSPEELLTKIDELAPTFYTDLDTRTIQFFTAYANEIKHEFTSHNITKSIGISTAFKKYPLEQLINAIIVNDFISSVEQTKLIFGDMVFYSDFFKRTAGFTGTRLTLANGNQINEWLNHNFKRKDKKVEDGTANIAIFEDVIVSVQQEILDSWANSLIEATKITREQADEILKPYTEITEGDAQGWITLDEWRNIMFRMGNPIPQEVFEKAQNGEILDPEEVIYFTPMKLLYAGPQKYDYLYVPAYHKFSLFPLLPSMVADKNIRKLMNTMTNQQVGYALFRSGSKVGTPVKEGKANAFYTEDGKINTENWQKQVIYYDFLGEQVKASDPVLEYTFGSQPKKLLFGGLFEEGKPINKHVGDLLGQFNSTINDIVQEEKEKLIKELGINPESYKSEDIKALLKLLRDEAKRRDLPDNLIESLQSEIINGKEVLKNKFDAQVNKIKIDSMLMSLVNSRLIRQKVLGDALIQVSSSGMESVGKRIIGTNALRFYRQDPLTGRTLPAEIMLAINLKDPSHQLLLEQYGTLEKLNSAIKKGKVDKEALQIIAYRIPTQGHNSMEFFEIVEFLPAESSTAMIVPTEIIAKAGSDFDIDKLFILKFNSRLLKLTKKQIAQNKIMNIAKEVLSMKEVFPSLITPNSSKILSDIADEIRFINKLNEDPDSDLIRSKFETKEQYEEAFNKKKKEYTINRKRAEEKNILYTGQLKLSGKNGKIAQFIRFLTAKNMIGIVALQNTHNILAQQHNLTIDGNQAIINLPHNKVSIQPEVEAISNFQGYKGGFEDKGKGTPQGDGKDKAMREVADGIITEIADMNKESSSKTSLITHPDWQNPDVMGINGKITKGINPRKRGTTIMLARNSEFSGKSLDNLTKHYIKNQSEKYNAEFVVGDMPNVDSQFIDYLQEIGAKFTIYHTGTTPRIKVEEVTKPTTEKADISISKLKDIENKNSISEVISQTITATVDAANDPFMFDINMNMETLPIIQYLTRSGTSFPIIGYFMSQPIINEYLKESSVHKSGFLKVTKNNKFRNQVLASVKEKYGKQSKDYTVKIFSAEELKNNLFKENQTSQEFKDQQLQILDDFLSYQTQAQFLSDAMRATNMDTWGVGKNLNLIQNKLNLIKKVKAQGFVKGIEGILEKSLIKSFNQLEFTQEVFGQFYYTQSPEFVKVKQDITNSIPVLGKKAEEQLATLVENDLINFIVQNHGYPNIVAYKDALFKSKPIAKELQRIKTNPKDEDEIKLSQNFFIRQLQPLISARKGDINNIKLYTRRYDTFLADQLTEAFREIKELNPDLAKQIMDLGILQSGLNNSPITYLGLIPYEYYNDITKQAFEKFNSQPLEKREEDLQQFEKLFLENNTIKTKAGLKLRQKKGWIFYKNYIKPLKSEIELKKRPTKVEKIERITYEGLTERTAEEQYEELKKKYPEEIIKKVSYPTGPTEKEIAWRVTINAKDLKKYFEEKAEEWETKEVEELEKIEKEAEEYEEYRKQMELSLLPDDVAIGEAIFKEIIDKLNVKYSENYKLLVVRPLEALKLLKEAGHAVEYTIHTAPAFYIAEDKTMVFPTNFLTTEVAFHEFAHPFVDAITEQNKPLFYNLKSQLSNPENASGQLIINEVIKEYSGDLGHVKDGKLTEKGWKEAIVTALGRMAKNQLNESKDKGLIAALKQLLKRIGSYLQSLIDDPTKIIRPVEIDADTTLEELAAMLNLENKIDLTPLNQIKYSLKAISIITKNLDKVKQWEKQVLNPPVFWEKLQQQLQIPKEQITLLRESKGNTIEEKLLDFAAKYSQVVEINVAKYSQVVKINVATEGYLSPEQEEMGRRIGKPTQIYSYLTARGRTDKDYPYVKGDWEYKELKIQVPNISLVSDVLKHAPFNEPSTIAHVRASFNKKTGEVVVHEFQSDPFQDNVKETFEEPKFTDTGEFSSDENIAFPLYDSPEELQEAKDKWFKNKVPQQVTDYAEQLKQTYNDVTIKKITENGVDKWQVSGRERKILSRGKQEVYEQGVRPIKAFEEENQFLQLLNQKNNWIKFGIQSIIQYAAKQGFTSVKFPTGDTAVKIEGGQTIEEFKKAKEEELEKLNRRKEKSIEAAKVSKDKRTIVQSTLVSDYEYINTSIKHTEQELKTLETQGLTGTFAGVYNFYENTITNILKKQGYNPKESTDEYGNKFNEIEIKPERDLASIQLKKRPETPEKEPAFKKQYVYFTRRLALLEKRQERFEKGTVNYNLIEEEKAAITKAIQEENYIEVSNETLNKVKEFITVLEKGESLTDDNIKFISDVLDVFRDFSSGQEENIASETLKLEKQLFPIIENFYLQQIKEHSTEPFEITKELVDAQNEDIGKVRLYTGSLLDTDNYIARTIGGIIRTAQNKRQTRDKQLKSKIEEERKLLESWAKKNGVTLSAAYDIFIQSKRGSTTLTQQFLETGEPNPNWTKIQKTPELLRFYNFYKTTITELQKDQLAKPGKYFIPNIESKTTWEKITSIVEKKTDISESIAINEELYADILAARYLKKVPEEKKSRDLSAILMAYGQHTNNYEEMSEILPTIRILQKGLQYKIINGKVEERSFKKPSDPKELVFGRNSNLNSMIDQVIDMQVFGKMRKPEAKFMESPIYDEEGKQTGTQYRLASDYMDLALKYNSLLRIGFSPITAGANWLFGDITNLIEAIGGRFFTLKGLQQATNIFVKQSLDKDSVLNKILIEELNILQDLEDYHHISDVSLAPVKKLSPEKLQEYAYAMQKGGEKWLQSRTAIAIMLKEGYITPNGTLTEKFTKAEQKEKQQLVDKIQRLNQMIHGRYTQQEAAIAQQYILYRMVIQFKKWLPAAIETRFGSRQWDVRLQVEIEGRYRTFWRMLRNITDSVNRLSKGKLTELELYNMKKNLSEIVLWTATILLYSMGRGDDDEAKKLRKNWAWKTAMLLTNRVSGDISFFFDPSQMAYTAKNAIPLIRTFDDARLALTYLPLALSEEGKYKVGSRKGQSKFLTKAAGITVGLKPISDIRRIIRERELEELR